MVSVEVPLNTMLADLDETLRELLKGQLERHGFEGIEIAFDAPTRDWAGQLSQPSVNLFLYDLRESEEQRPSGWTTRKVGDTVIETRAPMVMEASYAVTAWAQAVEDEHRLMSQVLSVLYAFPELPQEVLNGRLRNGSQPFTIKARVGMAKGDKADFWSAVGGQYKASLDYVVRLAVESGVTRESRQVRSQLIRTRLMDGSPSAVVEMHRSAGTVTGEDGEPIHDAWVTLPDDGRWAATDADGRYLFDRLPPGRHRVRARTPDGREAEGEIVVPGGPVDLVIGGARKRAGKA
jgi:hypothetical protein